MPVTINGNGSITGISAGGLPAGSLTLSKTDMPAGSVIQCVTDTTTSATNITAILRSISFEDIVNNLKQLKQIKL